MHTSVPKGFLVTLILAGCGPSRPDVSVELTPEARQFAEVVCHARENCNCSDARFSSKQECESELATKFAEAVATQNLTLDKSCFDSIVHSEVALGCPSWPWQDPCIVAQGTKGEGERCSPHFELMPFPVNECKDGLICHGGFCESPNNISFDFEAGDPCQKDIGCASNKLYCGEDGRCHSIVPAGEECSHYLACDLYYFCKGLGEKQTGICSPRAAPGDSCSPKDWRPCLDPETESSYWCDPNTNTCTDGEPGVCMVTHPVALIDE